MVDFKEFIKDILREEGGEILERDDEYIWVRADDVLILYKIITGKVADEGDVLSFYNATDQVNAHRVLICPHGATSTAEILAKKHNIKIIDEKELAEYIGGYVLKKITEGKVPVFEEHDDEEFITTDEDEFDEEDEDEEVEDLDTIPIILEDTTDAPEKIIKININEHEASKIAAQFIGTGAATLHLIPYFLYDYTLRIIFEGDTKEQMLSGIIAVNALTGVYEIWKKGFETDSSAAMDELKEEPKIGVEKAEKIARSGLIIEYTTEKEHIEENEHVTIIEKRKTKPLENSINISYLGLYYLPVWDIKSNNGRVLLNAATGEIIKKEEKRFF